MIPSTCKRLAEVDFPIAEVSRHAARKKSGSKGYPAMLHLWWARRPLASSRAVLMALLLPDPCDPDCPEGFKAEARRVLLRMVGRPQGWDQLLATGGAGAGALEEDARLTALFLWTLQSTHAGNGAGEKNGGENAEGASKGLALPFDVVRRFAQPLGIALPAWEGRVIETSKGAVRLLRVAERARRLFGEEGAGGAADWIESNAGVEPEAMLFPEMAPAPKGKPRRSRRAAVGAEAELDSPDATTLDRVHAAMLFQAGGRSAALRRLIEAEFHRGPAFLRLANALSALYPKGSEEKRLLDAMLLAVPR